MKKILIIISFELLITSSLMADFMRIEMGTGAWINTASGEKIYVLDDLIAKDVSLERKNTNPYLWILLKHPIPLIPNLRLEYVSVSTKGIANGTFEDFVARDALTQFDMTQYDFIPYYNLLDNRAFITLEVGMDIKIIELEYEANAVSVIKKPQLNTYLSSNTVILPLLYTRTRIEIPNTNIGLEADIKFLSYSSSSVYDLRVKIDYTIDFISTIQPAIELGYRMQKYDIDEADLEGKLFLKISGFYAGLMIRF